MTHFEDVPMFEGDDTSPTACEHGRMPGERCVACAPSVACPTCTGTGKIDPARLAEEVTKAPGRVARNAPATSRVASEKVRAGSHRWRILEALSVHGPANAKAIASRLDLVPNAVASRLGELRDQSLVEYVLDPATGAPLVDAASVGNTGMVQGISATGRIVLNVSPRSWQSGPASP